jgi:capsular exopolysaccharide synthesis family protein
MDMTRQASAWMEPSNVQLHLKDYLRIISARRWILISTFIVIVLCATVAVFVMTPVYRAEALLLIEPAKINLTEFKGVYDPALGEAGGHLAHQEFLETQYALILARPVLERTFEQFNFGSLPQFENTKEPIVKFRKLFAVHPVRQSRLAQVTFEWSDPELAARVLDFLTAEYIASYRSRAMGVTREGLTALREKAEEIRPQVEAKAANLQKFMVENNMVSLEETQNIVVERLKEINQNLTDIEKKRIEAESQYNSIEQALNGDFQSDFRMENLPEVASSQTIRDLKLEYIRTKQRASDLGKSFGPNHPEVKAAQAMIDAIVEKTQIEMLSISHGVKAEYDRAVRQERELRAELEKQESRVMEYNRVAVRYDVLKSEHNTLSKTYNAVAKRIEEIEIASAAGSKGDNIFVITHPRVPAKPVKPRKGLSIALSIVFGLAMGMGLCFFVEYLDTTVKTKEDAESLLGAPVIGYIPGISDDDLVEAGNGSPAPAELYSAVRPRSPVAEAFRSVRTALAFSGQEGGLKRILVTSATRGEGKSLSSVNIAVALAQTGKSVLLIDADMRKPRVHKIFHIAPNPGLSNLLAGEGASTLARAIQAAKEVDNLHLLPCGPLPPNPAELLQSSRMKDLLEESEGMFDVVVLDTPPLVSVTDAAILSQYVSSIVLVVRSFSTQRELILRARDIITETRSKVLGLILNNVDVPRTSYHGYYGYYYYGYSEEEEGKKTRRRRRKRTEIAGDSEADNGSASRQSTASGSKLS